MKAMKEKCICFVKKVRDRKTSNFWYEGAPFSRDEVRMTGHGALSSLKKRPFWVVRGVPVLDPEIENSGKEDSSQKDWEEYSCS